MEFTPLFIPLPSSGGGTGHLNLTAVLLILAGVVYFFQFLAVFILFLDDSFTSKRQLLYWFIPFLAPIIELIKKFLAL